MQTRGQKNVSGGGSVPDANALNCHPLPRWGIRGITPGQKMKFCVRNRAILCILARYCDGSVLLNAVNIRGLLWRLKPLVAGLGPPSALHTGYGAVFMLLLYIFHFCLVFCDE